MSSELVPAADVLDALEDAIAIVREFDGSPIEGKLAPFGLDPDVVRQVIEARWAEHEHLSGVELFVAAWGEALLTGCVLTRRKYDD